MSTLKFHILVINVPLGRGTAKTEDNKSRTKITYQKRSQFTEVQKRPNKPKALAPHFSCEGEILILMTSLSRLSVGL